MREHHGLYCFLDPFGMSVEWDVIELVAKTKAIDLWILFPIFAVNRMLVRGKKPPESWKKRLTMVFGTEDWEREFYTTHEIEDLLVKLILKLKKLLTIERLGSSSSAG